MSREQEEEMVQQGYSREVSGEVTILMGHVVEIKFGQPD